MIRKDILKEVINSQRKWIIGLKKGVKRERLQDTIPTGSYALVISGVRRCGKSTLLNQILDKQEKFYYLNLEDPKLEGFELKDFNRADEIFRESYGEGGIYFFDEVQNVDKWETFIRYLVDKKEKVVVTGSNASLLSKELGTKLTGRHKRIELFPFSYKEFLNFFNLKPSSDSYKIFLTKGGFPLFLKTGDETDLQELFSDIVMRDVAIRFGIKNTSTLKKIALYFLGHVGKEFSYNSLKKTFEIKSVQTVIDYTSFFEDAYLIFTVPKFSYSYKEQQINPKKVYSIDNGLSYANSVSFSKDKGKMMENEAYLNLRRKYKEIFYFQGKKECDFIIKQKNKITNAFQVCYEINDENEEREISGLMEAMEKFKLKKAFILTFNQEDNIKKDNKEIIIIPLWKWLLK
ncbi:MAG: ATP-binding protein [Nanoarchaeota archaeon]|nr:ATP-binding protein [Nanoarchaeota archaeon]